MSYTIFPLGDSALLLGFGNTIDRAISQKVVAIAEHFKQHPFKGLKDIVLAYSSVTFCYDPLIIKAFRIPGELAFDWVKQRVMVHIDISERMGTAASLPGTPVSVPVCYDLSLPNDLEEIAAFTGLSIPEIISMHMSKSYHVYMLGFLPGFAYMGVIDPSMETPRKSGPARVDPGSVGVAGQQTGIYSLESFGAWHIVGHTPLKMFDALRKEPCLLQAGQEVTFYNIDLSEYNRLKQQS